MGMFLDRGVKEFVRTLNGEIYVDKTDMIGFFNGIVNTEQSYVCVSRPRRFGKSITANMIAAYFEKGVDSTTLFEGRKLSKLKCEPKLSRAVLPEEVSKEERETLTDYDWKMHMNQYHVIRIDLAETCANQGTPEAALNFIISVCMQELHETFPNCIHEGDALADALDRISTSTGEKFVIIIDEWDAFFRDERSNAEIQTRYVNLLRGLFKGNRAKKFLALAYITGILPIKKYNSESALNNFYEYTMTNPKNLAKYIGFTEKEVEALCRKYEMDFERTKEWYNGYKLAEGCHMYNPNSVVQAMLGQHFESFWSQTIAFNSLTGYITRNFDGLKDSIVSLLGGNRQFVDIGGFENDMVNFKDNQYIAALDGYHGEVRLVGISYEKANRRENNKKHTCVIETVVL